MKAHLAKVSLALLSTVFLLGCQDLGSEPVGPEGLRPEFGHKDSHNPPGGGGGGSGDDATFWVTFDDGAVNGAAELFGPQGGKKNIQTTVPALATLTLSGPFQNTPEGSACFHDPTSQVSMQIWLKSPGDPLNATVGFWFTAKGNDGTTDINYVLQFDGVIDGGTWPAVSRPSTITGGTFTLGHSSGPGNKVACTGNGDLPTTTTIVVTRTS